MLELLMNNIVSVTCATVTAGVLGLIVVCFKRLQGLVAAVLAINHDQLYRQGEFYILTDQITVSELRNLEYLYSGYHALGGNGTGTEIYEKCKELPVVERRTKYNPYYTERLKGGEE